jgi:hypothetical protein
MLRHYFAEGCMIPAMQERTVLHEHCVKAVSDDGFCRHITYNAELKNDYRMTFVITGFLCWFRFEQTKDRVPKMVKDVVLTVTKVFARLGYFMSYLARLGLVRLGQVIRHCYHHIFASSAEVSVISHSHIPLYRFEKSFAGATLYDIENMYFCLIIRTSGSVGLGESPGLSRD